MVQAAVSGGPAPEVSPTVEHWVLDADAVPALAGAEAACRRSVRDYVARRPEPAEASLSESACDEAALAQRIDDPDAWSDVSVRPEISDLVAMNGGRLAGDPAEAELTAHQETVAVAVEAELAVRGLCPPGAAWSPSGHLWYPAGSALSWHTNARVPGLRAYLTWVAEPGHSYFRYREPVSGDIVTSWDQGLDLRVFTVSASEPFWHCVWAGTDRHSFGYRLTGPAAR
jgi:hypothetical protein